MKIGEKEIIRTVKDRELGIMMAAKALEEQDREREQHKWPNDRPVVLHIENHMEDQAYYSTPM